MLQLLVFFPFNFAKFGYSSQINDKRCPVTDSFTVDFHVSAHFSNEMFTDAKTKSSTLFITILAVADHVVLDEKFFLVIFRNSSTAVFDD